jgi:hypothetical protein
VHLAAGKPPQQEAVDSAEGELACFGGRARPVDVFEQPGDLAGGEIGIEQQPRLGGNLRLVAAFAQQVAKLGGAPVLPDDRVVDRFAGGALPDHRGFALIGDADASDLARIKARPGNRFAYAGDGGGPDCFRVVFDQAGRRIDLVQLVLGAAKRVERRIKGNGARRRGTLIDGDESCGQGFFPRCRARQC